VPTDAMSNATPETEQAHLESLGPNAAHSGRNRRLGIVGGIFSGMAQNLLQPEIIIGGMVYWLTANPMLVALVAVINKLGSLAPPLLVGSLVEHRPLRRPYFITIYTLRLVCQVLMIGTMLLLAREASAWALAAFFSVYLLVSVFGGTGFVLFMDMTGRLIRPDQIGGFLGMRTFLGGGVAIVCGLFVTQPILARVPLPINYVLLVAMGTVFIGIDGWIWARCREEPGPTASRRTTLGETFARGFRWLRADRDYRCYLLMRAAFRINYIGLVLLIPYGAERLAAGPEAPSIAILGGILTAAGMLSLMVSSPIWGWIADRFGSRAALLWAGVCQFAAPLLALLAPRLPVGFSVGLPGVQWRLDMRLIVFIISLAAFRAGLRGDMIGGQRFLITNAPSHRRTSYITFLNAITSPLALLPLGAAWLARIIGMDWVFCLIACGGVLSVVGALRMSPEQ